MAVKRGCSTNSKDECMLLCIIIQAPVEAIGDLRRNEVEAGDGPPEPWEGSGEPARSAARRVRRAGASEAIFDGDLRRNEVEAGDGIGRLSPELRFKFVSFFRVIKRNPAPPNPTLFDSFGVRFGVRFLQVGFQSRLENARCGAMAPVKRCPVTVKSACAEGTTVAQCFQEDIGTLKLRNSG